MQVCLASNFCPKATWACSKFSHLSALRVSVVPCPILWLWSLCQVSVVDLSKGRQCSPRTGHCEGASLYVPELLQQLSMQLGRRNFTLSRCDGNKLRENEVHLSFQYIFQHRCFQCAGVKAELPWVLQCYCTQQSEGLGLEIMNHRSWVQHTLLVKLPLVSVPFLKTGLPWACWFFLGS